MKHSLVHQAAGDDAKLVVVEEERWSRGSFTTTTTKKRRELSLVEYVKQQHSKNDDDEETYVHVHAGVEASRRIRDNVRRIVVCSEEDWRDHVEPWRVHVWPGAVVQGAGNKSLASNAIEHVVNAAKPDTKIFVTHYVAVERVATIAVMPSQSRCLIVAVDDRPRAHSVNNARRMPPFVQCAILVTDEWVKPVIDDVFRLNSLRVLEHFVRHFRLGPSTRDEVKCPISVMNARVAEAMRDVQHRNAGRVVVKRRSRTKIKVIATCGQVSTADARVHRILGSYGDDDLYFEESEPIARWLELFVAYPKHEATTALLDMVSADFMPNLVAASIPNPAAPLLTRVVGTSDKAKARQIATDLISTDLETATALGVQTDLCSLAYATENSKPTCVCPGTSAYGFRCEVRLVQLIPYADDANQASALMGQFFVA